MPVKFRNIFVLGGFIFFQFVATMTSAFDIPVVPSAVAKADYKPYKKVAPKNTKREVIHKALTTEVDKHTLNVKPGVNHLIPVAVNHTNRFVTPYNQPAITTNSTLNYKITENVVYVSPSTTKPITIYITESGDEGSAISITLVPQRIAPRELTLLINEDGFRNEYTNKKAEKWELAQPYISTIEKLLKTVALGSVPSGYKLDKASSMRLPVCRQTGLTFKFDGGQTLIGNKLSVHIGTVVNRSPNAIEIQEAECGDWNVAGVSAYPDNVLDPGDASEIYVAVKNEIRKRQREIRRPSLINSASRF